MPVSSEPHLVHFRGGFVAHWTVVKRLLDLERRGCRFELLAGGRFRVIPPEALTPEDVAFMREHRDEARAILAYNADASESPQ